jgi:hypothetical protein
MKTDDPNVPMSFLVGIGGAILLFVIIVLLQAVFFEMKEAELGRKVYTQPYEELRALDADQLEILNSYGWVDERNGVARIPISRAMDLMATEAATAE